MSSSEEEEKEDRKGSLAPSILRGSRKKRRRMDHDGRGGGRKENKKAQTKLKNDCNQNGKQSGENYESTLSVFWIGNEANKLDDNFENTPTPWGG